MALPGFKTTTTTRSIIIDAAVRLAFMSLEVRYPLQELNKLATISSGGTPSRNDSSFYGGDIPWAKISDITKAGKWISETEEYITQSALEQSSAKLFPAGTVFFSMYGSIGKTSISTRSITTNQAILGLIPNENIQSEYLYYALINARTKLFSQSKGTSQKNINGSMVKEFEIPLPPLEETKKIINYLSLVEEGIETDVLQDLPEYLIETRRIVARIEELAVRMQEALSLRERAVEEAKSLERSYVDQVYKSCAAKFGTSKFADVSDTITDGDHITPRFTDMGVKFIFVGNVSSGFLHFKNCKYVLPEYYAKIRPQRKAQVGDILYSAVGATLGVPAIVDQNEEFCFQRHIAIIKPNRSKLNSRFLWHMLRSTTVFETAWANITGTAQPTVPLNAIRKFPIPIPPLDEQWRIVAHLDAVQAKVDELRRLQAETQAELVALMPSILDRAFKGEL